MKVSQAKESARVWIDRQAGAIPGFQGAFLTGSTNWMPGESDLPFCSDVDIKVVIDAPSMPESPGKFVSGDVILDVSYIPAGALEDPEKVLADYQLASAFQHPSVLADRSGKLSALQHWVGARFAQPEWIHKRCEHARAAVSRRAAGAAQAPELHERVTACQFAAGANTHIVLVAGLRNPTVRRRYAECQRTLASFGHLELHERLLRTLGAETITATEASMYLDRVSSVFDIACDVLRSPYRFAADMTRTMRPVAIGGSREMIGQGLHREAMFWILNVYSRSRAVISVDAPEAMAEFDADYRDLLGRLGMGAEEDLSAKVACLHEDLEALWPVAMSIARANAETDL